MKTEQPDMSRRGFLRAAAVGTTVGAAAVATSANVAEAAVVDAPASEGKTPESAHMAKYYEAAKF